LRHQLRVFRVLWPHHRIPGFRSTFLPRVIGVLLAIGALCYLTYSFASFISPGFAAHLVPYIQLPSLVGEGSFCLWLLIVGVNV
ncbi:MAG: DUF4386 family protein, partial [Chloroflexi bacterium]